MCITHLDGDYLFLFLLLLKNGIEATKQLRSLGYPYLIIGLTGNVMADDVKEFSSAGADMILFKPLRVVVLKMILDFISTQGAFSRRSEGEGFKLIESFGKLEWVPVRD